MQSVKSQKSGDTELKLGADDLSRVLGLESSEEAAERKEWADLRDRLAYVEVTGSVPTHLRPHSVRLLRDAIEYSRTPTSLDGESGSVRVRPKVRLAMRLTEHPMVIAAARYVAQGYRLAVQREPNARRPFGRVWAYLPLDATRAVRATIHGNGAVREGWI